jgi:FkbM family methyltransferase
MQRSGFTRRPKTMLEFYKCRHGRLGHFSLDTTIGASLCRYGEWAESEIFLLSKIVQSGDTILDIGANVGTHSLAFSRIVGPRGTVISFEAQHRIYELLAMNLMMNGLFSALSLNVLVGARTDVVMIPTVSPTRSTNFGGISFKDIEPGNPNDSIRLPIAMITVDTLNLKSCELMKVDVEGMEMDVFKGASKTVEKFRPAIYFEQTGGKALGEISNYFCQLSYSMFWHVANPYNANNFLKDSHNIFGGTCEVNILAIPNEKRNSLSGIQSELSEIFEPIYSPPIKVDAIKGWSLPEDAYIDLAPTQTISLP